MAIPTGFEAPPPTHATAILGVALVVAGALWRLRPPVSHETILAFAPWMALGAVLHAAAQLGIAPSGLEPLIAAPAVYLTTAALAGATWSVALSGGELVGLSPGRALGVLAATGALAAAVALAVVVGVIGRVGAVWPAVGVGVAVALTYGSWRALARVRPEAVTATGRVGVLVVFAHALDGVTTAVGVDVFGFVERTPLSRVLLDVGAALPTAPVFGSGWVFVLVKLGLAMFIVRYFAAYVREEPARALALLGVIAAVGLGPGVQNLVLYLVQ